MDRIKKFGFHPNFLWERDKDVYLPYFAEELEYTLCRLSNEIIDEDVLERIGKLADAVVLMQRGLKL